MTQDAASSTEQTWSADSYDRNVRFVSELGQGVVDWLAPKPGERILDVGCGDGVLTRKLVDLGVDVVGVDSSPDFVKAAQGLGLDARLMDGEALTFDGEFDAVLSNAALHWMRNAGAVADGVSRALKPGGRFVAEFGGHTNVAAIVTALRAVGRARGGDPELSDPWYFPTPAEYSAVLEAHGLTVRRAILFPRPIQLPTDMAAWLMVFREPFFRQFGVEADDALAEMIALLKPSLCDESGVWTADYVRLRVEAHKVNPAA